PHGLAYAYGMIATIEKWENISEFLLSIPTFVEHLSTDIIREGMFFIGNQHVEQALTIIDENLEGITLTVNWLAAKLNISTTHLANLLKNQLDETTSRYIKRRKIDEVIYELTYTKQSINLVSSKYGL